MCMRVCVCVVCACVCVCVHDFQAEASSYHVSAIRRSTSVYKAQHESLLTKSTHAQVHEVHAAADLTRAHFHRQSGAEGPHWQSTEVVRSDRPDMSGALGGTPWPTTSATAAATRPTTSSSPISRPPSTPPPSSPSPSLLLLPLLPLLLLLLPVVLPSDAESAAEEATSCCCCCCCCCGGVDVG